MGKQNSSHDIFLGVDIGSILTKAVLLRDGEVLSYKIMPSGRDYAGVFNEMKNSLLGGREAKGEVITGYGTSKLSVRRVSDLLCHGRGINFLFPDVRTIIEIGGQASRVIRIDERGKVLDFVVSEKCAAGSGRFLQVIANVLRIPFEEIGELSLKSKNPVSFTTGCAAFAETEAVSRVAEGYRVEDILYGVHVSIATKVKSLVERIGLVGECAVTGGGAKDKGLIRALEEKLSIPLLIPPEPLITGALGAAIIASEQSPTSP